MKQKKIMVLIILTGLISCGNQNLPPRIINNYADIHLPISHSLSVDKNQSKRPKVDGVGITLGTCERARLLDQDYCAYNKIAFNYSEKKKCDKEYVEYYYVPITERGVEIACEVKRIDNTKE